MHRLARHLFTLCSAVSLALCVAAAVMWSRSYWHITVFVIGRWPEDNTVRAWGIVSAAGGVELVSQRDPGRLYGGGRAPTRRLYEYKTATRMSHDPTNAVFSFAGVAYQREKRFGYAPGWPRSWRLPYWFLVAVTAAPPVLWSARAWKRHRRTRLGLCPSCGYDLRATPDRCPECGASNPAAAV